MPRSAGVASRALASMQHVFRTICALSLVLAAVACSDDSGVSKDTAFGGLGQPGSGQGVVILGMRMIRQPTRDNLIFGQYEAAAWFLMSFRGVDGTNHFTDVERSVQLCDQLVPLMGVGGACDPTIMAHRVLELPAGRYVLTDFTIHEYQRDLTTDFVGKKEYLPFSNMHGPGWNQPPALVQFDVKPGEITYIGDFNWDPEPFPARCVLTRDDIGARAALFDYPLIQGAIVFRAPTVVPVASYPKS